VFQLGGEKLNLKQLNAAAKVIAKQPRTREETARLIKQLEDSRATKRIGVRANNLAAAADSRMVVARIQEEVSFRRSGVKDFAHPRQMMTLFERTGTRGVALFTRGNCDDHFMPTYAESGGGFDFFLQTTKVPGLTYVRQFEQWSCMQERGKSPTLIFSHPSLNTHAVPDVSDTMNGMRRQITGGVNGGLGTYSSACPSSTSF
jgi:hypothetical protein